MKKTNFWFACLATTAMLATTFTACSSDDAPDYVAPTISMGSATTGEANLSDNLKFTLPVNITSEAGLASIVVTDSEGTKWLEQTSFTNPNSVSSVELDFSNLAETKILLLTVTATAKDGKVTRSAQPYSLNVYVPQLYVAIANVATITENATMDITIGRGLRALASAKVYLNNTVVENISLSDCANDKKILKSVNLTGLVNGKNPVKVEVFEEGSATAAVTESSYANKVNADNLRSFTITQGENSYSLDVWRNYNLDTDEDVKGLTYIKFEKDPTGYDPETYMPAGGILRYWKLVYTGSNVTTIEEIDEHMDEEYNQVRNTVHTYEFTYNTYNELTKVTMDKADYVTDIVYEEGQIASYKIDEMDYQAKYEKKDGIRVRVDCLNASMSGNTFGFTGTEKLNPLYIQGLPAVIPGNIAENIPLQAIYSSYLFNSLNSVWNAGWVDSLNAYDIPLSTATVSINGTETKFQFMYYAAE